MGKPHFGKTCPMQYCLSVRSQREAGNREGDMELGTWRLALYQGTASAVPVRIN